MKGFLESPLHAIHQTCKSSQLIILNVFKYKLSRFLQFWYKLNTYRIVKTCPFHFLRDHYGDSLEIMFLQFSNDFLRFPWCFSMSPLVLLRFPRVFLLFLLNVSPVSYFRLSDFCCGFQHFPLVIACFSLETLTKGFPLDFGVIQHLFPELTTKQFCTVCLPITVSITQVFNMPYSFDLLSSLSFHVLLHFQ